MIKRCLAIVTLLKDINTSVNSWDFDLFPQFASYTILDIPSQISAGHNFKLFGLVNKK